MVLSRVRLIRDSLVLVNLNPKTIHTYGRRAKIAEASWEKFGSPSLDCCWPIFLRGSAACVPAVLGVLAVWRLS